MTIRHTWKPGMRWACVALAGCAAAVHAQQAGDRVRLEAATLDGQNRLAFPAGTERWIAVGSSIGGEYSDEPFDPASPGMIGVVQIEPAAYDYFLEHGEYADGTMFLLSFYMPQEKPDPALPGFVQGDMMQREIHLIDAQQFPEEGRAFYIYAPDATAATAPLPPGSVCFECHMEHGGYDGTFMQFYPQLREHFVDLTN